VSYLIQRTAGRNLTLTQVSTPTLRIGRGTNQDLRSENPAVALEHAVIESDAAGYVITDKGSITGTYVNGKPVESQRLVKGDAIEIGDLRLEIQLADPAKPLFLRVAPARSTALAVDEDEDEAAPASPVAAAGARVVKAKKFDYVAAYRLKRPWLTKLSLTAILLIVLFAVIGDFLIRPEKQTVFMPGGVSSAHSRARDPQGRVVGSQCNSCHTPFKSVTASKCMSCHPQDVHAQFENDPPSCYTCHAEHRGQTRLAAMSDQRCVDCHANLTQHAKPQLASMTFAEQRYRFDDIARIASFGQDTHPEFRYPPDRNTLRFNHRLHLAAKGIFNGEGRREVLQCAGCHEMVETRGKVDPTPIDFEQHCQSCHKLTFDIRYPNAQVPHGGDPGIVYGFIGSYQGDPSIASRSADEIRRLLAARKQITSDQRAVIAAAQVIKTKCQKCHDIESRGGRLAVRPPVIPTSWLTHARFTHTSHRTMQCETCHSNAKASAATADLLLPARANCTGCHAKNASVAQAASTCVTCHEYHLRPQRPVTASLAQAGMSGLGSGGRMLQGILLATIVILLLVVLVPVGIALFQRLKPERPTGRTSRADPAAPPRERNNNVPVPPTVKNMRAIEVPTDKVLPRTPPDIAPPPPARAPEPSVGATRMEPLPQMKPTVAEGQGTEMVQWYGMLHCTAGPLEGQRFVVEEDGFYIGRDPVLSKVVVNDTRVSKRHVRILPRDGKVWAIDEGSTNGTYLASAPGNRITEVQLKRGDTLILGDNAAVFVYQI
jgi:pSer/pThr/pTyr-binding forkhead associated (FHA) protein